MHSLSDLDLTVSFFLASIPHTPFTTHIFTFFSLTGLTIIIWFVITASYFIYEQHIHHAFIRYFLTASILTTVLVNYVLKYIVARPRPWVTAHISNLYCPHDFSFPSGHAAGAFCGAVIFTYFDPKRSWLYFTIAGLIGYSRIFLYCHYLTDVLAGAIIGMTISYVTIWLFSKKNPFLHTSHVRGIKKKVHTKR